MANESAAQVKEFADAKAKQENELARNRAKLEIGNSVVHWQLKQLSELYGPLHALLCQSNAIYRHMNVVLGNADPLRFRLSSGGDDFDKQVFEISLPGEGWVRFRTIMHIGEAYGKGYGIDEYFDEVVAIGNRVVTVIESNAGYARPDQKELLAIFGKYLAHYAVLKRLRCSIKARYDESLTSADSRKELQVTPSDKMKVEQSAVFPQEIQQMVDTSFEASRSTLCIAADRGRRHGCARLWIS